MRYLLFFAAFISSFETQAYSPLVATPACWNGENCEFTDLVFEEHCPKLSRGKGYCNNKYNESYRIHFGSYYGSSDDYPYTRDRNYHFFPDFTFTDKKGKVVYQYNEKGVFYKGKKVCSVTKGIAIPYLGKKNSCAKFFDGRPLSFDKWGAYDRTKIVCKMKKEVKPKSELRYAEKAAGPSTPYIGDVKPCPMFYDGPIRYLSSHSNVTGGAELVLDYFDGDSGWVNYKGEKLFIKVNDKTKIDKEFIRFHSKKLADDIRKKNPILEKYIQSRVQVLKKQGIDSFLTNLGDQLIILSDPDYIKFKKSEIVNWYQSSSFFKEMFNRCLDSPQIRATGGASTVRSHLINSMYSDFVFTLKGQNEKMPMSVQCSYLNMSDQDNEKTNFDIAKKFSLEIYFRAAYGDGFTTDPNQWLY